MVNGKPYRAYMDPMGSNNQHLEENTPVPWQQIRNCRTVYHCSGAITFCAELQKAGDKLRGEKTWPWLWLPWKNWLLQTQDFCFSLVEFSGKLTVAKHVDCWLETWRFEKRSRPNLWEASELGAASYFQPETVRSYEKSFPKHRIEEGLTGILGRTTHRNWGFHH